MKYSKYLTFFYYFYLEIGFVFPYCILAPDFFSGQITLGLLMQVTAALSKVKEGLDWFVENYAAIAELRATTDRLHGFSLAVDEGCKLADQATVVKRTAPDIKDFQSRPPLALEASHLRVELPGRGLIWDDASLEVRPGEHVLLLGPDGCGKSVFLRALAGCWPASGNVQLGPGGVLFVPQHPFVPAGSLRAAVAYPENEEAYSEEAVREALSAARLEALKETPLEEEADWQKRLSGGERQRLALAHAMLRRPSLLLLDEASSAIGEVEAAQLYATLAERLPADCAIVSVDHEANAKVGPAHHTHYKYDAEARQWARVTT